MLRPLGEVLVFCVFSLPTCMCVSMVGEEGWREEGRDREEWVGTWCTLEPL